MFRKYLSGTVLLAMFSIQVFASGIQVLNTSVTTNDDKKSAQVKFSLTWDHSWRLSDGPKNWDAAWVFIKYRTLPGDNWSHAYIKADGSLVPSNAALKIGNSMANVGGVNTSVGVGAFIFRKDPGNGTVAFPDIELRWDFPQNGLTGGEQVEVCVLATEMVYIPQGQYFLGDMASDRRFSRNRSNAGGMFNEEAVTVNAAAPSWMNFFSNVWNYRGSTNGTYDGIRNNLRNNSISSQPVTPPNSTDDVNPANRITNASNYTGDWVAQFASAINGNFPRGFNAFYCMKYEITQGEYIQFLNKNLVTVKNAGTYHHATNAVGRYGIKKRDGTGTANVPAEYDLTNPSAAFLPCNYLGTKDIMAWLVWAGLRPMSEFEFEKICRGPEAIPTDPAYRPQYAWGTTNISAAAGFANKGGPNEAPSNAGGNSAVSPPAAVTVIGGGTNTELDGPMRAGGFATPVSSREKAGATYYGVMEMSGNLWERCVSAGINEGRMFQGALVTGHGNGEIGPGVNPSVPMNGASMLWPSPTGAGLGFRGGSYLDPAQRARISDRMFINLNNTGRHQSFGGRGVRSDL